VKVRTPRSRSRVAAAPTRPAKKAAPARAAKVERGPRQQVTAGRPQPSSREDVYLSGAGPGWVDPEALGADRTARAGLYTGPLFRDEPTSADVQQGQLGDCYFAAALAGIAATHPEAIKQLIQPAADGSADVTFHQKDPLTGTFQPVVIHVDAELYESSPGAPLYGHSPGDRASMELWFPLVEKAWATLKGGYDGVTAGVQNQVFEAVLGRPAGWLAVSSANADAAWDTLSATVKAGLPIGAATRGVDDGRYARSGVYADHGYTVLGADEENGQRFVTLRNPWGSGEPRGDGKDDGVFRLPLARFLELYEQLQFTLV
jgi:hypothetical protein